MPSTAEASIAVEGSAKSEGRASRAPQGPEGSARAYLFQPGAQPSRVAMEDLPGLIVSDRNFVWVDLSDYTPQGLEHVAGLLGLRDAGIHVALSSWTRPRIELFDDHFLVTATAPELDHVAHRVTARELDLFVGRNFLLSAHKHSLPMQERILVRAQSNPKLLEQDSALMLYIILDELLSYFEQAHEQIEDEIEHMEERALRDMSDTYLQDLLRFKRYVFALSQLADQHRLVFAAFLRPDFPWITGDEVKEYYRDLQQHLEYVKDAFHADKDAINGAFDIYVSHASHRTNSIMKLLTIVSTILLPASVLFGFFGTNNIQNVPLLTSTGGFIAMMVLILLISGGILVLFHQKSWL